MRAITERDVRSCFVNCSKGDAKRLNLPKDFAQSPWTGLDFLGWRDPKAPDRAYLIAEKDDRLTGVARRSGDAGKQGNTVGRYLCADLACSLYVRGMKQTLMGDGHDDGVPLEEKVARIKTNLDAFITSITT
ncbi:FBP domain-containing protein [Actinomadura nitritigenes]|uniref:FBP domain-containing protein n=1 Tax=Actinomadura nitritigenes TaxID=134602 RepID=UPI003D8A61F5